MIQKMLHWITALLCLVVVQNVLAWHIQVKNETPFALEAKCKKVGAIGTEWVTINALSEDGVKCGGADCPNGVHIKVMVPVRSENSMKGAQEVIDPKISTSIAHQVIKLETDWSLTCGNVTVRVFLVPTYKNKEAVGFKIALGTDVDVSEVMLPA